MNVKDYKLRLNEFSDRVLDQPWGDKEFYALWSAQTYFYVSHSTRLLALAASRFGMDQDDLHNRFLSHAREEARHERLSTKDLKSLGRDLSDYTELSSTGSFYQSQYFWIQNVHPITFMGYITALEGMATISGKALYKLVAYAHGKPASNFVAVHGQEDPEHLEKAYEILEKIPADQKQNVWNNFDQSCTRYLTMMGEIKQTAGAKWKRAA